MPQRHASQPTYRTVLAVFAVALAAAANATLRRRPAPEVR
jgi:hypothetical protein